MFHWNSLFLSWVIPLFLHKVCNFRRYLWNLICSGWDCYRFIPTSRIIFLGMYSIEGIGETPVFTICCWEAFRGGLKYFSCLLSNASSSVRFCLRCFQMSCCCWATLETHLWCSLNLLARSYASIYLLEYIKKHLIFFNKEILIFALRLLQELFKFAFITCCWTVISPKISHLSHV